MTTDRNHAAACGMPTSALTSIPVRKLALVLASALLAASAAQAQPGAQGRLLERLDTNGDGVADTAELVAARRAAFERADLDGDGFVTGDEVERLVDSRVDMPRQRRGGLAAGTARRRMPDAGEALRRLDADGDGRVSEIEFVEAGNPLLERFDANSDGEITRDEVEKARQRMRDRSRQAP